MQKILIVEDDRAIAEIERDYLELEGFGVEIAQDGPEGLSRGLEGGFDLILLDLMLPGMDGFLVCQKLRQTLDIPIVMVTARREDIDKIRGLGLGADDYVEKPFSPGVLVARVKAHLAQYQRLKEKKAPAEITLGAVRLNTDTHRVFVEGQEVSLKNKEYELLLFLMLHVDMVFDRETLYEKVWGLDAMGDNATVAVHINRLREKIERDPAKPQYIETVSYTHLDVYKRQVTGEHGGDDLLRRHLQRIELLVVIGVRMFGAADVVLHKGDRLLQLADPVIQVDLPVEDHLPIGQDILLKNLAQLPDRVAEMLQKQQHEQVMHLPDIVVKIAVLRVAPGRLKYARLSVKTELGLGDAGHLGKAAGSQQIVRWCGHPGTLLQHKVCTKCTIRRPKRQVSAPPKSRKRKKGGHIGCARPVYSRSRESAFRRPRSARKNARSVSAHSASSTPRVTEGRWL